MKLRKAALTDGDAVLALYREAQAFLAAQGIDQWQDGYPNRETFLADVGRGESWVLEEGGQVAATACLGLGRATTYDILYDILIKQTGDIHSDWDGTPLDVDAYGKAVFEPYDLKWLTRST